MKKLFICIMLFSGIFSYTVFGQGEEMSEFLEVIPEEVAKALPDEVFDDDMQASKGFGFDYFWGLVKNTFKGELGQAVLNVSTLLVIVIISSLFHKLAEATKNDESKSIFQTVSALVLALYVFTGVIKLFERTALYLKSLTSFATAATPIVTMIYALGGNVGSAAVSESGLMVALTLIEYICSNVLYPVLALCALLTIASNAAPKLRFASLSGFVRGIFMLLIALTVTAISTIMAFQTSLASAADTLTAKAVKFAASSFIPVVGSAVSEAVRTVSASIMYIRTSVGLVGIASVVIITLPLFINLMITRITLAVCASVSDMLGCERECKVLKESGGLVNFLIALVSLSALMFIYILTLLARCASAYGA